MHKYSFKAHRTRSNKEHKDWSIYSIELKSKSKRKSISSKLLEIVYMNMYMNIHPLLYDRSIRFGIFHKTDISICTSEWRRNKLAYDFEASRRWLRSKHNLIQKMWPLYFEWSMDAPGGEKKETNKERMKEENIISSVWKVDEPILSRKNNRHWQIPHFLFTKKLFAFEFHLNYILLINNVRLCRWKSVLFCSDVHWRR